MKSNKTVMVFGVGELQKSIIDRAHLMGIKVIGIDPCKDAFCKDNVDVFEAVDGQDFEGTVAAAKRNHVNAIVTAATDKPLVMMAKVARELGYRFFSENTARWSTDKFQMKQRLMEGGVPCAKGVLIRSYEDAKDLSFPVICKPRDNSGSRGVKFCKTIEDLQSDIDEALEYSKQDTVLVEEFIDGQEYSIESIHYNGKSEVIQFTQKETTEFPYNVELGHLQPADLSEGQKCEIRKIIGKIGQCLEFENCPSHTELKINDRGIFVIETSPRLGGDYITSTLVPLSTGVNMEDQVLNMALGLPVDTLTGRVERASGVRFFCLPEGIVERIDTKIEDIKSWPGVVDFDLKLKVGDKVNRITSSLNRYGQVIVEGNDAQISTQLMDSVFDTVKRIVDIR